MSSIQSFLQKILPKKWAEDMESESRAWVARCPCGHERSIWELGGVRWKASGNPRRLLACASCGKTTWHTIQKKNV